MQDPGGNKLPVKIEPVLETKLGSTCLLIEENSARSKNNYLFFSLTAVIVQDKNPDPMLLYLEETSIDV